MKATLQCFEPSYGNQRSKGQAYSEKDRQEVPIWKDPFVTNRSRFRGGDVANNVASRDHVES